MSKLKVFGMGNRSAYQYLIVERRPSILQWLEHVVVATGLPADETVSPETFARWLKNDSKAFTDRHWTYSDQGEVDGVRIDFFIGKSKIFIVFICQERVRRRLMREVLKRCVFVKTKEIPRD